MPKPFQWGKVIRCPYWRSAGPDLRIGPRALLVLWSAMERGEVRTETPGAGGSDLRCAPVIHLKSGEEKMSQLGRLRSAEGQRTRGQEGDLSDDRPDGAAKILKELLMIAVPITISSSMVGIVTVIDSALVQGQIQKVLISDPDSWALYQQVVDFAPLEAARDAWQQAVSSGAAAEAVS